MVTVKCNVFYRADTCWEFFYDNSIIILSIFSTTKVFDVCWLYRLAAPQDIVMSTFILCIFTLS